jgi:membrane protein required for colicin V production
MTWIDVLIGGLLLLELFKGWKNGFASEVGSVLGIVLGFVVASVSGNTLARFLSPAFNNSELWSRVLAFLLTFLAVFVLILILSKIFEGFLKVFALDWINKVAGSFFCILKGMLVLSILLNIYQSIDEDCSMVGVNKIEKSIFYKPVRNFAPSIFPSLKLFQHHGNTVIEESN